MIFGGGNRNRSSGGGGQMGVILLVAGLVLAILSPLIGQLIRLGVSRKREYMADADAVNLTRYPAGLAGALKKIAGDKSPSLKGASTSNAHLFISSPLKGGFSGLFSTHPPIQERIKRLEQM
jgi:heat shock protein HtpX